MKCYQVLLLLSALCLAWPSCSYAGCGNNHPNDVHDPYKNTCK